MLADVQPDSPCLAMYGLNGGRQRPREEERSSPCAEQGPEAAEDKGLQGHSEIRELDTTSPLAPQLAPAVPALVMSSV